MDARVNLPANTGPRLKTVQVMEASVFMRRESFRSAPCETELLFGETIDIYKEINDWVWGQIRPLRLKNGTLSPYAGYIGWLPTEALADVSGDESFDEIITAIRAPVFLSPNIKSPVTASLCLNSRVRVTEKDTNFYAVQKTSNQATSNAILGFLHKAHITERDATDFVTVAEQHLGLPYIWGGISTNGLDCSGLVRSSLRAVGYDAPRDADQQLAQLGRSVMGKSNIGGHETLQRGDLIFWRGHVGIMQSTTHMIHANAGHMCVASEPLVEAVKRIKPQSGEIAAIKRLSF